MAFYFKSLFKCARYHLIGLYEFLYFNTFGCFFCCRVTQTALHHVVNYIQNAGGLDSSSVQLFSRILVRYVSSWQAAEEAKRRAQMEKESLYKYKSTVHGDELTEEQRDELAIRKAFPSFEKVNVSRSHNRTFNVLI